MEDADRLVPEFRVAIMLANGWNLRRLIRKKIEIQFDADFPDSRQLVQCFPDPLG